jgi:hypothetical protein
MADGKKAAVEPFCHPIDLFSPRTLSAVQGGLGHFA